MNIADLSKIDVKNIAFLHDRKKLLNIGIIVFALIIAKFVFSGQMRQLNGLKAKKEIELKKNSLMGDIGQVLDKTDMYKRLLSDREIAAVMNSVSQMANEEDLTLDSISPEEVAEREIYKVLPIELIARANDYHQIANFINKLEQAKEFYIIEKLSLKPIDAKAELGGILATIKVKAVSFIAQ